MNYEIHLRGKRVLVAGSTDGIGLRAAEAMHEAGASVVINSHLPLDEDRYKRARAFVSRNNNVYFVQEDMSVLEGNRRIVERAAEMLGDLDVLLYNAGMCDHHGFLEDTPEQFDQHIKLNVRGGYFTAQAFARHVGQRNYDACIIFTSSVNAMYPELSNTLYDMTKAAIAAMVRGLSVELGGLGIRVNAVAPGLHDTGITHQYFVEETEDVKAIGNILPARRLGTAEDPAPAYVFLASDAARYITGTSIDVSGGLAGLQITAAFNPQRLDKRKK